MPRSGKGGRYHHGDLRAALIDTAVDLIGERGVRHFSLAEASRRLGVAVSAPYAPFSDRDDLLAAVAGRGHPPAPDSALPPAARLAAMTAAYIRFAAAQRPLFEVLYDAGLDKARYPELAAAQRPVDDAFLTCVTALTGGAGDGARDLATALEATARGHAAFLLDGSFGQGPGVVEQAADRAVQATLALIESRHLLSRA